MKYSKEALHLCFSSLNNIYNSSLSNNASNKDVNFVEISSKSTADGVLKKSMRAFSQKYGGWSLKEKYACFFLKVRLSLSSGRN
jgi:hypothetical protein